MGSRGGCNCSSSTLGKPCGLTWTPGSRTDVEPGAFQTQRQGRLLSAHGSRGPRTQDTAGGPGIQAARAGTAQEIPVYLSDGITNVGVFVIEF